MTTRLLLEGDHMSHGTDRSRQLRDCTVTSSPLSRELSATAPAAACRRGPDDGGGCVTTAAERQPRTLPPTTGRTRRASLTSLLGLPRRSRRTGFVARASTTCRSDQVSGETARGSSTRSTDARATTARQCGAEVLRCSLLTAKEQGSTACPVAPSGTARRFVRASGGRHLSTPSVAPSARNHLDRLPKYLEPVELLSHD